jgi:predicted hydrocarbon binding protein
MDVETGENDAVNKVLIFLKYYQVGKVVVDETIRIEGSCESVGMLLATKRELASFFSSVRNQHVKETKCIAMGDPYCEGEFR